MGFQLTTVSKCNCSAARIIVSGSPLKPVKDDEEAEKMNEAEGADDQSVKVRQVWRRFHQRW